MQCPNCFSENEDGAIFCQYCGSKITQEEYQSINHNESQTHELYIPDSNDINNKDTTHENQNYGMTFHYIYSIILLWAGGQNVFIFVGTILNNLLTFSADAGTISPTISGLLGILISIVFTAFPVVTGILLLMKKRIGYIFSVIHNWFTIVGSSLGSFLGLWIWLYNLPITNPFENIIIFIGICILVASLPGIIFSACSLLYYKKRKSLFQ